MIGLGCRGEAQRIEAIGIGPQAPVPVHGIDRDHDQRALQQAPAGELEVAARHSRHHRHGRVEAHRLLEHHPRDLQRLQVPRRHRTRAAHLPHLGADPLLPLRRTGCEIERPGQRLRRRLMAGEQEGQQIVDELVVRHRLAGLRIARGEQPAQEILGTRGALLAPAGEQAAHGRAQRGCCLAGGTLSRMPEPLRQPQQPARHLPARPGQQPMGRALDLAILFQRSAREDRVGDHVVGRIGQIAINGLQAAGRRLSPAGELRPRRGDHRRHVADQVLVPEQGGDGAPLPAPGRTFRGEDALAECRLENAALQRRLGKALVLVQQDPLDETGIGHPHETRRTLAVDEEWILIGLLGQRQQRIAHELDKKPPQRQGLRRRNHGRRIERRTGSRRSFIEAHAPAPPDELASCARGCRAPGRKARCRRSSTAVAAA